MTQLYIHSQGREEEPAAQLHSSATPGDASFHGDPDVTPLLAEIEMLKARERQIMELINCAAPDRIIHDLRNLMNEMQLLRILAKEMQV